jgi:hypothetical protein
VRWFAATDYLDTTRQQILLAYVRIELTPPERVMHFELHFVGLAISLYRSRFGHLCKDRIGSLGCVGGISLLQPSGLGIFTSCRLSSLSFIGEAAPLYHSDLTCIDRCFSPLALRNMFIGRRNI